MASTSTVATTTTHIQHDQHIRVAMLAYSGTPRGSYETNLLRNSVDLVIPNPCYFNQIDAVASNTPQMIYTNVSNIYGNLLTDWLNYAARRGFNREGAFYHVNKAMPFTGDSGSSKPVNWFWSIHATATVHKLNGKYRVLRADGTLGPVVSNVRLRNGEGAILIRA